MIRAHKISLEKEKKIERKKSMVRFQLQEGRGRKFNHAPRAGKELTAGGSRTQTSMADATGNVPSAMSKVGRVIFQRANNYSQNWRISEELCRIRILFLGTLPEILQSVN